MAETRLSITTMHDDGTAHRKTWVIPVEQAVDVASIIAAAYGQPKELIASADAVQQMATAGVPGVVVL